jgi:hypothetical protein
MKRRFVGVSEGWAVRLAGFLVAVPLTLVNQTSPGQ